MFRLTLKDNYVCEGCYFLEEGINAEDKKSWFCNLGADYADYADYTSKREREEIGSEYRRPDWCLLDGMINDEVVQDIRELKEKLKAVQEHFNDLYHKIEQGFLLDSDIYTLK